MEIPDYNFATPDEALQHISEAPIAEMPLILHWIAKRAKEISQETNNPPESELAWMKAAGAAFTLINLDKAQPQGDAQAEDEAIDKAREFYNRPETEEE